MLEMLPERIREKIRVENGCWVWTAGKYMGYGRLRYPGFRTCKAHRIVYQLLRKRISDKLTIDHLCRNRSCVNPAHLEPVSLITNVMRGTGQGVLNEAKTHCPRGHEYNAQNTYQYGRRRICRTCGGYKLLPAETKTIPTYNGDVSLYRNVPINQVAIEIG